MNRHEIQRRLNAIDELPTLPAVAMELNRMLQDMDTPIEEMVALLERDQSLVIRLLRLVNSSFYGFKSRISSLRHAVTLMGYATVQNAVVTVSVIDCLKTSANLKAFDLSRFWVHSISVAVMSSFLAARTGLTAAEEAFTGGLVHDVGKVILVEHFPEVFAILVEKTQTEEITFHEAETASDTLPHHLIGSHLAKHWMLPDTLDAAIRHHHPQADAAQERPLADLVAVADLLVHFFDMTPGHQFLLANLPAAVRGPIAAVFQGSRQWIPQVRAEMAAACAFFNKG